MVEAQQELEAHDVDQNNRLLRVPMTTKFCEFKGIIVAVEHLKYDGPWGQIKY